MLLSLDLKSSLFKPTKQIKNTKLIFRGNLPTITTTSLKPNPRLWKDQQETNVFKSNKVKMSEAGTSGVKKQKSESDLSPIWRKFTGVKVGFRTRGGRSVKSVMHLTSTYFEKGSEDLND